MKKIIGFILLAFLIVAAVIGYFGYSYVMAPNVSIDEESILIQIPSGSDMDDVIGLLEEQKIIKNSASFRQVAKWMNYKDSKVQAGNFRIQNKWNNRQLVTLLRSGKQEAIKITFNQCRTIYNLAARITQNIELDSAEFIHYVLNPNTLSNIGYTQDNIMTLFIPNTYEVYWNISADRLLQKMQKEYDTFWSSKDRQAKLQALNLSKTELYILASIVEKETIAQSEKPMISQLYINRLRKGMKLEADPTVVFATGLFDLKRVLFKHLEYDSPYNTYRNLGLPPGPIFMPDVSTIDATLNPTEHDFIFFCAKADNSGKHAFASTNAGHEANARKYHAYLNSLKIR